MTPETLSLCPESQLYSITGGKKLKNIGTKTSWVPGPESDEQYLIPSPLVSEEEYQMCPSTREVLGIKPIGFTFKEGQKTLAEEMRQD